VTTRKYSASNEEEYKKKVSEEKEIPTALPFVVMNQIIAYRTVL